MNWRKDSLVGMRFSKLVVIEQAPADKQGQRMWLCRCDCGQTTITATRELKQGRQNTCGKKCGFRVRAGVNPDMKCRVCGNKTKTKWEKSCSVSCYALWLSSLGNPIEIAGMKVIGYANIHTWLSKHYGKADQCEDSKCSKNSTRYEWAVIHEKGYERNRNNFRMLCKRCHNLYDSPKNR